RCTRSSGWPRSAARSPTSACRSRSAPASRRRWRSWLEQKRQSRDLRLAHARRLVRVDVRRLARPRRDRGADAGARDHGRRRLLSRQRVRARGGRVDPRAVRPLLGQPAGARLRRGAARVPRPPEVRRAEAAPADRRLPPERPLGAPDDRGRPGARVSDPDPLRPPDLHAAVVDRGARRLVPGGEDRDRAHGARERRLHQRLDRRRPAPAERVPGDLRDADAHEDPRGVRARRRDARPVRDGRPLPPPGGRDRQGAGQRARRRGRGASAQPERPPALPRRRGRGGAGLTLPPFDLHRASSVEEARELLVRYGDEAAAICGGTELLLLLKLGFAAYGHLVDLKGIEELGGIQAENGALVIGATATHREIERSPLVLERLPALARMERRVANIRVRNVGTLGGNLCFSDPHSDPATFLLALDAEVEYEGTRRPLAEFLVGPYETALAHGQLLRSVRIPLPPEG